MSYQFSQDPEENLPEWLKELRERQGGEPEEPPEDSSAPAEEKQAEAQQEVTPPPDEDEEGPDWLLEIRKRHESDQELNPSEPAFEEEGEQEVEKPIPAFDEDVVEEELSSFDPESGANNTDDPDLAEPSTKQFSTGTPPGWLGKEEHEEEGNAPQQAGGIAQGELPSWLEALKPPELSDDEGQSATETSQRKTPTEPLEGLEGVLPAGMDIGRVGRSPSSDSQVEVSKSQSRHVAAFQRLLANEGLSRPDDRQQIARPTRILRFVFGAVLILAALIPFITGSQAAIRPALDSLPESAAIYNKVELMPDSSPVLVVFEVQPALFGEIEAVSLDLFDHLLDQQARLVFISTQPTGPGLVDSLLERRFNTHPVISTGQYANLGYLSGGTSAIRNFAAAPRQTLDSLLALNPQASSSILEGIDNLEDFGLILVISGDAEDGRAWIEQAGSYTSKGILMAVSAQAEPLLLPYLNNEPNVLEGLIGGLDGGAYYERLRSQGGLASIYWESYSFGLGAIALLILVGGLYRRLIHLGPEESNTSEEESDAV